MKFAVQVHGSPYGSESGDSAYQFIRAALAQGHEVVCVFFYHEASYQGLAQLQPPADEINPSARWAELALKGGFLLDVCISAAQRRGLASADSDTAASLATGFRLGGLGQWVDACIKADRVLVFRD